MRTYPLSRLELAFAALFGFRRCELCNARQHRTYECWLLQHQMYAGLIYGYLHARPDLEQFRSVMGPRPKGFEEHLAPVYKWAADEAKRSTHA